MGPLQRGDEVTIQIDGIGYLRNTLGYPVADHPDSPLKRPRVALDELVRHDRWS